MIKHIHYTPFLKLKQNEIFALKELENDIQEGLTPFFDIPRDEKYQNQEDFISSIDKERRRISKHLWSTVQFYMDTFDIEDIDIEGTHSYEYILEAFNSFLVIPVIGIDRSDEHKQSIINNIKKQNNASQVLAFRITTEDFQSYALVKDELIELFENLLHYFIEIDLIFDNRLCQGLDIANTAQHIATFYQQFSQDYPVRKTIITGSSIPPTLTDICQPNDARSITRQELLIYNEVTQTHKINIDIGDYTTVSPLYSEASEMAKRNGASKLIYADGLEQHIWRGRKVITHGQQQYNEHIQQLIQTRHYHGKEYSWADKKFYDTQHNTSGYWTSSIIKPIINAHISYMAKTHNY